MKEEGIDVDGVVSEVLPGGKFKVVTEDVGEVTAHLSGKMRKNKIRVVLGDSVIVEVSAYDYSKGRITFRHK